jgi:DnaK suppressor protein
LALIIWMSCHLLEVILTAQVVFDELSEEEQRELEGDLLKAKRELVAILESNKEESAPVDLDLPIGRISRMDAMQQQSMAKANRASAKQRLALIGVALKTLEEGDYGFCRDCDEPIGFARLKARPETPFCVTCQGSREG